MKISLNGLVELLSAMVGRPFDIPLQEQFKVILNVKRADWFQKVIAAHPYQRKYYLRDISVELEEVDEAECPVQTDCTVYRSKLPIPTPLRTEEGLFDYVGDADKVDAYGYASTDQLIWVTKYSKYTNKRPKYFYVNKYIYIYNIQEQDYINVRAIWTDPRELSPFKCDDVPCYTDEDQFDIPEDIINTMIQDVLKNEIRLMTPQVDETTVDEQNQPTSKAK